MEDMTSIRTHFTDRCFRINEFTGVIAVKSGSSLDFETVSRYDVTIIAEDHGSPPKQVRSEVKVAYNVPMCL